MSSNFRLAGPEQTYGTNTAILSCENFHFWSEAPTSIPFTWYSDDYRLCAFGVVSEYLLPELADALQVYKSLQFEVAFNLKILQLEVSFNLKTSIVELSILHHDPPGKTWCWREEAFTWTVQKTICWWPRWTQAKEGQAWRSLWIYCNLVKRDLNNPNVSIHDF